MAASITYWNRLEPTPRSLSVADTLAARVRDPLWILTRQWQLAEFQGADGGAPAYVQLATRTAPISSWGTSSASVPLGRSTPPEKIIEAEGADTTTLTARAEIGETLRFLLEEQGIPDAAPAIQTEYPLTSTATDDADTIRFLLVCNGRSIDGSKILADYLAGAVAASLTSRDDFASIEAALAALATWVTDQYGAATPTDPAAWSPAQLDYDARLGIGTSSPIEFSAEPGRDSEIEWYSLDVAQAGELPQSAEQNIVTVMPAYVRFKGMPNARFWDFENATADFGAVDADETDLGRLLLVEFAIVQGNDWFIIPVELPAGSATTIDYLIVNDVFGRAVQVMRADAQAPVGERRWTMFSTTDTTGSSANGLANFFTLAPTVARVRQDGSTLEEVRFIRDEVADMAWAIERTTENVLGLPTSGREKDAARRYPPPPPPPAPAPVPSTPTVMPLRYQLQSSVPTNWIPLLPEPASGSPGLVQLAVVEFLDATPTGEVLVVPSGRVLQPEPAPAGGFAVPEHVVPRAGLQIKRVVSRVRWIDGSTHVWVARRRSVGRGEGSSGLKFDQALYQPPPSGT